MYRNRPMLTGAAMGYDRVPPTQRLADPTKQSNAQQQGPSHAVPETKEFCETVIDSSTARELRMPRSDGALQSYKCVSALVSVHSCLPYVCTLLCRMILQGQLGPRALSAIMRILMAAHMCLCAGWQKW
jgi:hypothetical protein